MISISTSCPKCSYKKAILLSSLNKKICANCNHEWAWKLKEGEKSIYE